MEELPEIIWVLKIIHEDEGFDLEFPKTEYLAYKRAAGIILGILNNYLSYWDSTDQDNRIAITKLYAIFQKGNYKEFYDAWQELWITIDNEYENVYVESAVKSDFNPYLSKEDAEFMMKWIKQ